MAIRSGTGGLKYPLPNQGQLSAQMSAAAASSGGSAAASTFGANRSFAANKMRVQADLANSAAERQFRAMSQMEEQGFRAQQQFYDREHDKGSQLEAQRFGAEQQQQRFDQQREMQWQDQYYTTERDRQQQGFQTERDKTQFEQDQKRFEQEIDAGIEGDMRSGKLELSPEAQKEMQALESGRIEAQKLDPQQRADFEEQYQKRKRDLLRTAKPPKGPTATEAYNRGVVYRGEDGRAYDTPGPGRKPGRLDDKGVFQQDNAEADQQQQKQQEAQRAKDEQLARKLMAADVDLSPEEAVKQAREQNAALEQALNPPPVAPTTGQPPAAQPGVAPGQPPAYRPSLEMPDAGTPDSPLTKPLPGQPAAAPANMNAAITEEAMRLYDNGKGLPYGQAFAEAQRKLMGAGQAPASGQQTPVPAGFPPGHPNYSHPDYLADDENEPWPTDTAPQQTPPGPASGAGAVPKGFPTGTAVIAPDTYALPDGRIVRRTGK
jgi:hypothetical protein